MGDDHHEGDGESGATRAGTPRPPRRSPFGLAAWAEAGFAVFKLCGGPMAWMPGAGGGATSSPFAGGERKERR
jgi:hypothetical protein